MTAEKGQVRVLWLPLYSQVRALLVALDGWPRRAFFTMRQTILAGIGTPQHPRNWTEPDTWIPEVLSGQERELAERMWRSLDHVLNPRYTDEPYFTLNSYELAVTDDAGVYRLTSDGRRFVDDDQEIVRRLDESEGVLKLLEILVRSRSARIADLLPEWDEHLRRCSRRLAPSVVADTLRSRLLNLSSRDRGLVERQGYTYVVSHSGLAYLTREDPTREITEAIYRYNNTQRKGLREKLGNMDPNDFEKVVASLLQALGYEDVRVVGQRGDRGVDVVATVQLGISAITEVVQVKRHTGSLGRSVVNELQGALPHHGAIRGTLITLGTFSEGAKKAAVHPHAAPITLVDGDMLLALLVEHEIGIRKSQTPPLYGFDDEYFAQFRAQEQPEAQPDDG